MKKHGIRGLLILALIWALIGAAWAEEMLPASIREAQSAEEANALLIQSDTGERLDVVSGQVRLIVQTRRDDMFCADYWRSGEEKGEFDLTAKENRYGAPYAYYIGTMCTRAVYSMALSYLGVDMTPVDMSVLAQRRTLNEPYDEITALVDGLARRGLTEATFDEMMAQYLNDERYSPLYIYMKRTNGVGHALLIVGYNAERKRFVAVDPSPRGFQGDTVRTYELSFAGVGAGGCRSDLCLWLDRSGPCTAGAAGRFRNFSAHVYGRGNGRRGCKADGDGRRLSHPA